MALAPDLRNILLTRLPLLRLQELQEYAIRRGATLFGITFGRALLQAYQVLTPIIAQAYEQTLQRGFLSALDVAVKFLSYRGHCAAEQHFYLPWYCALLLAVRARDTTLVAYYLARELPDTLPGDLASILYYYATNESLAYARNERALELLRTRFPLTANLVTEQAGRGIINQVLPDFPSALPGIHLSTTYSKILPRQLFTRLPATRKFCQANYPSSPNRDTYLAACAILLNELPILTMVPAARYAELTDLAFSVGNRAATQLLLQQGQELARVFFSEVYYDPYTILDNFNGMNIAHIQVLWLTLTCVGRAEWILATFGGTIAIHDERIAQYVRSNPDLSLLLLDSPIEALLEKAVNVTWPSMALGFGFFLSREEIMGHMDHTLLVREPESLLRAGLYARHIVVKPASLAVAELLVLLVPQLMRPEQLTAAYYQR